jgi:hypothetical protein
MVLPPWLAASAVATVASVPTTTRRTIPSPRCSPALTTWTRAKPAGHTNGGRPQRPVRSGTRMRARAAVT